MTRYRILNEALGDIDEAASWYEEQREGLGLELTAELREVIGRAVLTCGSGALVGQTPAGAAIRRYRLRRFRRYAVIMATIDEVPTVLAFEHSSRRPHYWRDRLG